ncbi:hypothetical protein GRI89_06825 [Altererythrobacter salegens]|uniref:Uncharacterized protein n=1 Tax=Croceibacterium salegens TaxID=1737568 RepID=A0A6I4STB6_9SPHN|nr:hypothetical protein [Croceibacterium salegens]MXO59251.1 hypothetical protein [Croceibacterium salegens]
MSIRFAAPPQAMSVRLRGARARAAIARPGNDNGIGESTEAMLRASLRHFAEHGLAAAAHARAKAEAAWFNGDKEGYRWWLGICRTLDRRMARELAAQTRDVS